ncbi:hypothetical protein CAUPRSCDRAFT_11362 [Caulochytrium protostelioides]|uniref:Secreted protein n=1 Tax=Caulochytrium protostelioides TaxID=1555241 RepID=A0A4P9WX95_9FUNG|nr:hypothetical protein CAUPRSCDRAFT_11362 [Caulochytrium protostelioides]
MHHVGRQAAFGLHLLAWAAPRCYLAGAVGGRHGGVLGEVRDIGGRIAEAISRWTKADSISMMPRGLVTFCDDGDKGAGLDEDAGLRGAPDVRSVPSTRFMDAGKGWVGSGPAVARADSGPCTASARCLSSVVDGLVVAAST